jgi:Mn2+/Fe2+ NRAMP family transporter
MSPVGERENLYANLGPGLITGAADDDPSGIATYSQVGAQFGFAMLWTMLFSFPSMAAIREICSRLGRITGMGVAANPADAAMAAFQLLVGRKLFLYAIFFGGVFLLLQVYVPYRINGAIVSALDFLASFTN